VPIAVWEISSTLNIPIVLRKEIVYERRLASPNVDDRRGKIGNDCLDKFK
jgi:hypothetical protein